MTRSKRKTNETMQQMKHVRIWVEMYSGCKYYRENRSQKWSHSNWKNSTTKCMNLKPQTHRSTTWRNIKQAEKTRFWWKWKEGLPLGSDRERRRKVVARGIVRRGFEVSGTIRRLQHLLQRNKVRVEEGRHLKKGSRVGQLWNYLNCLNFIHVLIIF